MVIKILEHLVLQLKGQWRSEEDAMKIATSQLIKSWNINEDGTATEKGIRRGNMSAGERAIDRQAERSGRDPDEYEYIEKTNSVRLKKWGRGR